MKVKITGVNNGDKWYSAFVGSTFTVKRNDNPESYAVVGMSSPFNTEYGIEKTDCEVVDGITDEQREEVRLFIRDKYDLALWEVMDGDWLEIIHELLADNKELFSGESVKQAFENGWIYKGELEDFELSRYKKL